MTLIECICSPDVTVSISILLRSAMTSMSLTRGLSRRTTCSRCLNTAIKKVAPGIHGRRLRPVTSTRAIERRYPLETYGGQCYVSLYREAKMFDVSRVVKSGAAVLVAAIMFVAVALPSYADTGSVRFRITRAGFIVGAGGGTGVLVVQGKSYPLSVGGLSVGMLGAASADLVGCWVT